MFSSCIVSFVRAFLIVPVYKIRDNCLQLATWLTVGCNEVSWGTSHPGWRVYSRSLETVAVGWSTGSKCSVRKTARPPARFTLIWKSRRTSRKTNSRRTNIPRCHLCRNGRARPAKMATRKIRIQQQVLRSNDTSDIPSTGSPVSVASRDFSRSSCPLPRPLNASISRDMRKLQRKRPILKCLIVF